MFTIYKELPSVGSKPKVVKLYTLYFSVYDKLIWHFEVVLKKLYYKTKKEKKIPGKTKPDDIPKGK